MLNNIKLVYLDQIIGSLLIPVALLNKVINKFISIKCIDSKKIVVVKFLGVGNFVAINDHLENKLLITSIKNKNILEAFGYQEVIYIDDSSIGKLFFSTLKLITKLIFTKYQTVINLESESRFAKSLCLFASPQDSCGLSSSNRSILDSLIYKRYLVKSESISMADAYLYLLNGVLTVNSDLNEYYSTMLHRRGVMIEWGKINTVAIYPSCSSTDRLRRLSDEDLSELGQSILNKGKNFNFYLQSKDDEQYPFLMSQFPNNTILSGAHEFVDSIKKADLVITIDSLALHVAQNYDKHIVAYYGPTSPTNIKFSAKVVPIYNPYICSPCTHKYFNKPCNDSAYCMKIEKSKFRIYD
jgi:ADP-heptose:LPS heptosyltransferase